MLDVAPLCDPNTLNGGEHPTEYDLISVITHIGRSADSGHYISWTKEKKTNTWWKFDDDKVIPVSEEDIKRLDGGGDWHIAYLLLYQRKQKAFDNCTSNDEN